MKVTWLGQAGLLFENENIKIMVDPYLSDSCGKMNPKSHRRVEVDEKFFDIKPTVLVLTHDHLDHTDEETLAHFLGENTGVLVLASGNAWNHARKVFGGDNNYVMFNEGTIWTESGIKFTAVYAEHSDSCAIGVIIDDGNKKYYVTGDTLYNKKVFKDLPSDIDVLFLPVNGVGNNMNMVDAEAFSDKVNAKYVVPLHFGLFDEIDPRDFKVKNAIIPKFFEEIEI